VTETELVLEGTITESKTPDQWAQVIRADLGQAVAGFVAAGENLARAKASKAIPHGEWENWCKQEVGISPATAVMLMALPRHEVIANPYHGKDLPPSWRTLYELSRLDPPLLIAAIEAGDVHQEMERKSAVGIVADYKKAAAVERAKSVQPGQWWQLGEHRLYCGDSADEAFTSRASGTFAFADPPYNAGKAEWDHDFTWRHDYLADTAGIVAVTPGISAIPDFHAITKMPYHWAMAAWITNGMTRGALGFGNWIYIALFSQQESLHRGMQDHMRISVSQAAPTTRHESRKPAELLVGLLEAFTDEGDTVIDPFLGSGTTLFAAEQSGRKCVGAEIEPEFCSEIITRYGPEAKPL
jgi:hypothetical protein